MGFFTINRKMLPMKLHYGLFNAGASIQIVMPTYTKVFGFSTYVVGVIYTILPLTALFIKPAFGALSDKFKWHKGVLILWVFLTMMGFGCTWFIPAADKPTNDKSLRWPHSENMTWSLCEGSPTYLTASYANCTLSCPFSLKLCQDWNENHRVYCQMPNRVPYNVSTFDKLISGKSCLELKTVNQSSASLIEAGCRAQCAKSVDGDDEGVSDSETFQSWKFWVYVFLLVLGWGGISVSSTITDTICVEICGDYYGQQRLWGSLTWGLTSMIAGFIIDAVSEDGQDKNYLPAFIMIIPPIVLDIIVCSYMKVSIPAKTESLAKDAIKILLAPKNLLFSLWCILVGASFGVVWNFLFWLLEDLAETQGNHVTSRIKTIEGVTAAIETFLGETPAFFFGGWIVHKLGHGHSISLVMAVIGLRFVLYSLLTNPWYFLPVEILQNNYGLFYSTMTSYAKKISLPGTEATIQTILCGLCEGVGVAIGSYLGGLFYDQYGGSTMFLIFGVAFFVIACINEIIEFFYRFSNRKKNVEENASAS